MSVTAFIKQSAQNDISESYEMTGGVYKRIRRTKKRDEDEKHCEDGWGMNRTLQLLNDEKKIFQKRNNVLSIELEEQKIRRFETS